MNLVSCAKLDAELADKQDKLLGCDGSDLAAGTKVPSCAEVDTKIAAAGANKQDKLLNCAGAAHPANTKVPTCDEVDAKITAANSGKQDKITGGTSGQVYTVNTDGTYSWKTPASGGTTELADGVTILGTGTTADKFRVARPIPSGGTSGQVLIAKPDGSAAWETPASSGLAAVAVIAPLSGNGTSGSPLTFTGGTSGQVLTKNPDGTYGWTTPTSSSGSDAVSFFFGLL